MGGKSKKQTVGYKFYAGANLVLARFISKLLQIQVGDKQAWEGTSSGGDIAVDAPLLFGTKLEGGVTGTFRFRRGESLQDVDPYLASLLGSDISADIGVSSLTLVNPYLGNNPYIKDISVRAERVFELEDGVEQWYVEKAGIVNVTPDPAIDFDYDGGASFPNEVELDIGSATGKIILEYATGPNPDKFEVWFEGIKVIDTGYHGKGAAINPATSNSYQTDLNNYLTSHSLPLETIVEMPGSDADANAQWASVVNREKAYFQKVTATSTVTVKVYSPLSGTIWKAAISREASNGIYDINPVHMIREALLNTEWGYGYDTSDIDDSNFRSVADTLYDEGFGLSYFWDDDSTLDSVINKILDHVDGVLYLDRDSLKFKLALNRADYDPDTLIELRTNIEVSKIDNYKKPQFLDLYNTVTVNYYNISNGGSGSLSSPNSALFLQQGVRKSIDIEYSMCCNASLAARLLQREIDKKTNPFSSCDVYANSAAKTLRRGSVFKLTAPDYNYNQTIMRVTEISYGDGKTKAIKISCTEDRFAMPSDSAVEIQQPDPTTVGNPVALSNRLLIEEPYAFLVERLGQTIVDNALSDSQESGYFGTAAKREGNALVADIYTDDGSGYENVARLDFCPYGELQSAISYLDSSFTLENFSDLDQIEGELLFQIDDEIMALGSINTSTGAITGALRGCFDTVPAEHAAGAKVFFIGAWLDGADKEYVDGETINVKLVPTNSLGTLSLSLAPVDSLTFASRAIRPYAPGLFKIGGTAYPASASGAFNVTWAHRDRKAQADQIVDTLQASLALPTNQRYGLAFYQDVGGTLLVQRTDIGAATASVTLNYTGDVRCELWTINNDGISIQRHSFVFAYTPPGGSPTNQITATAYTPVDDSTIIDGGGD